ncbi:MAG: BLUF domain-containing protein [Rhodobacteraceae bacterium]|nr:BLUF domain-containing protein [Paracoccaceae bacterium]
MTLIQLIYSSRPFGFDQSILNGILATARRHNPAHDITGALICRSDLYLQLLEGPEQAVDRLYCNIICDDRHLEVRQHLRGPIQNRLFSHWAMLDDPARSWVWPREKVRDGALEQASPMAVRDMFVRLRRAVAETG